MTAGFEQIIGNALHTAGWHLIAIDDSFVAGFVDHGSVDEGSVDEGSVDEGGADEGTTIKSVFLQALGAAAGFPSWAGSNWDATEELLTDFSWLDTAPVGFALVLPSLTPIAEVEPKTAETLSAILGDVTQWWAERNVPFVVLHRAAPKRLDSEAQ